MSEPKNHHLVPVCYLKNFGKLKPCKGKPNYMVDAHDITKPGSPIFTGNVRNICVEKEFYTFKNLEEKQKRFLEKYFSEKIERHFTPIYKN